jgi:hypothetical protein
MSQIYITKDGDAFGPFTVDELNEKLKNGKFKSMDKARVDGMGEWLPLSDKAFAKAGVVMPATKGPSNPLPADSPELQKGKSAAAEGVGGFTKPPAGNLLRKSKDVVEKVASGEVVLDLKGKARSIPGKLSKTAIHVAHDGRKQGPFSVQEVNEKLKAGEFELTDLAWMSDLKKWRPLSNEKFAAEGILKGPMAMVRYKMRSPLVLASCIFAGLTLLGLFFPWFSASDHHYYVTKNGFSAGWGVLTFCATVAAGVLLFLPNFKKVAPIVMGVGCLVTFLSVFWNYNDLIFLGHRSVVEDATLSPGEDSAYGSAGSGGTVNRQQETAEKQEPSEEQEKPSELTEELNKLGEAFDALEQAIDSAPGGVVRDLMGPSFERPRAIILSGYSNNMPHSIPWNSDWGLWFSFIFALAATGTMFPWRRPGNAERAVLK